MQQIAPPALAGAGHIGQLIRGAGRQQYVASLDVPAAGKPQREAGGRVDDAVFDDLHAVAPNLGACDESRSAGGIPSRDRKPCMCVAGALRGTPASITTTRRLARPSTSAALRPAGPPPTIATSLRSDSMRFTLTAGAVDRTPSLLFPGTAGSVGPMADSSPTRDVLAEIGPRLRRLRERRA